MAECNHVFVGRADGVHCTKCGMHLTAADYAKQLNPEEKPKRQSRKKVKTDE